MQDRTDLSRNDDIHNVIILIGTYAGLEGLIECPEGAIRIEDLDSVLCNDSINVD